MAESIRAAALIHALKSGVFPRQFYKHFAASQNSEKFKRIAVENLLVENSKKRHVARRTPSKRSRLPKCHYCGAPIRESLIVKIEGSTGEVLFYCSGECCDDDWK